MVFVSLAAVNELMSMAATILANVGSGEATAKPPLLRLIEVLRRQTVLLVLDNLEQINDAASLIAAVLAECPGVVVSRTESKSP